MIDNMCHRKRNDYKIDMAIDTFWHESIVHKIGKVLLRLRLRLRSNLNKEKGKRNRVKFNEIIRSDSYIKKGGTSPLKINK